MGDLGQFGEPETVEELREALARAEQRAEDDRRDTEARLLALENAIPDNARAPMVDEGHFHYQPIEGLDGQVSQGFGYQLDAVNGIALTRGAWPLHRRITLDGGGSVGPFCFDYLVRPSWTGTEGKEFTFQDSGGSFFVYSTLAGAMAAAILAAANNSWKTIMVCSNISEPPIAIDGLGSSATILITSPDRYGVRIIGAAFSDIFIQSTAGGAIAGALRFRNIGLAPAVGKAVLDANTDLLVKNLEFEDCYFPEDESYLVRQEGDINLQFISLRVSGCTGTLAGLYEVAGSSAGVGPNTVAAYNNRLTLAKWWDGGTANADPDFTRVQGGVYTVADGLTFPNDHNNSHWSNFIVYHAGGTALFRSAPDATQAEDWSFQNIVYKSSNPGGRFCDLGTHHTSQNRRLLINNIYGFSSHTPAGVFVEVDPDWDDVYVGAIHAPQWPTVYAGPAITPAVPPVIDASDVTFTPGVLADWLSSADPGNVDDALDQLASLVFTAADARTAVPHIVSFSFGYEPHAPQVHAPT
jgi:hypothetical protein